MADRNLILNAYDRNAHTYDAKFTDLQHPKYAALFGETGERFPAGRPCLDVGCGSGLLVEWLRGHGRGTDGLVGVDLSRGMLEQALARGLEVCVADAAALPFADGAFEAAVSITALGLVEGQEEVMLAEARRVLAPGGRLVVSVLERYANARFTRALRRCGFTIEGVVPCGQDIGFFAHV